MNNLRVLSEDESRRIEEAWNASPERAALMRKRARLDWSIRQRNGGAYTGHIQRDMVDDCETVPVDVAISISIASQLSGVR